MPKIWGSAPLLLWESAYLGFHMLSANPEVQLVHTLIQEMRRRLHNRSQDRQEWYCLPPLLEDGFSGIDLIRIYVV